MFEKRDSVDGGLTDSGRGAFFRRIDWSSFWTSSAVSFLVYFITLGPAVTLEDSGELAVAGDYLGVPHPPGYPIWTMLAYVFARVFGFVTYMGQPTPAWSISLMSAVFGALAVGLTAMLVTRVSTDVLRHSRDEDHEDAHSHDRLIAWVSGVSGSLVFAFSPVMWSQSTIVEVYTLNAFFLMLIFLLTYRWLRRPSHKLLWVVGFVFGLGMTNYLVLALAVLPLVIVVMLRDLKLFRDFCLAAIPFIMGLMIMKMGASDSVPNFTKRINLMGLRELLMDSEMLLDRRAMMSTQHRALQDAFSQIQTAGLGSYYFEGSALGRFLMPIVDVSIYVWTMIGALLAVAGALVLALRPKKDGEKLYEFSSNTNWLVAGGVLIGLGGLITLFVIADLPAPAAFKLTPGSDEPPEFPLKFYVKGFLGLLALLYLLGATLKRGIWYAVAVTAIFLPTFLLMHNGSMLGLFHPATGWFWFYVLLNFVVLALIFCMLPNGRTAAITVFCAELGLSFYIYMPLASERNPPMNWGYPRTWQGFKHSVGRGQYEQISPAFPFSSRFLEQLSFYFWEMRMQFTLLIAPLGIIPFTMWSVKWGEKQTRVKALYVAGVAFVLTALFVVVANLLGVDDTSNRFRPESILIAVMVLLGGLGFLTIVVNQTRETFFKALDESLSLSERVTAGLITVGIVFSLLAVVFCFLFFGARELADVQDLYAKAAGLASNSPAKERLLTNADVLTHGGWQLLKIGAIAALLVGVSLCMVLRRPLGFKLGNERVIQKWQIATTVGFVAMSMALVMLANPKTDVQDAFIQKVKFISSHGLFALWIGFAIALLLGVFSRMASKHTALVSLACMLALILPPLIPIHENYFNEDLINLYSAAEQSGHDFGWQFGNYQLRGAEAINEELAPQEEPVPNPYYPEAMEQGAIFFGGTDPGRFVPTYMIYSAAVRDDVFLITQNALADQTYMNIMRDLYGEEIWIPSSSDNQKAFNQFVDEVKSGKRPKNSAISIVNGRVQVTGALGVMEINAILCEMIFKHNRDGHGFYVEESYPIRWMFPYMSPHGLILKVNREKQALTQRERINDMDFWDWYMRRLSSNYHFQRDAAARRGFSKLRGALAGMYVRRGDPLRAERAFREALMLYPYSPEANFRLIQEVLLPSRRYEACRQMLEHLKKLDPNNSKITPILGHVKKIQALQKKAAAYEQKSRDRTLTLGGAVKLADVYAQMGALGRLNGVAQKLTRTPMRFSDALKMAEILQEAKMNALSAKYLDKALSRMKVGIPLKELSGVAELCRKVKNKTGLRRVATLAEKGLAQSTNSEDLIRVSRMYLILGDKAGMIRLLEQYLKMEPDDWEAWLDMAMAHGLSGNKRAAKASIQRALKKGGVHAEKLIKGNKVLRPLLIEVMQERMNRRPGGASPLGGGPSW